MNLDRGEPKVSIIIVNWNGEQYIKDCLASVFNQFYKNFRVILVDNGSTDKSIDFVKDNFPKVKIIALEKNYGFTGGNNFGIREAFRDEEVKYIALLNVDTKVQPQWLKELMIVAESNAVVGCCQPKVLSLTNPKLLDAVGIIFNRSGGAIQLGYGKEDFGQYNQIKEVFGACAAAVLYRREMLEKIGLFDEDFFSYYEDVDLALRVRLAGWKCIYVPASIVYHKHSYTYRKDSPVTKFFCERNTYYYIIKNLPIDIVIKFFIRKSLSIVSTILRYIRGKKFELLRYYLKANFEAMINIPKMFKKRNNLRSIRIVKNKELRRQFTE